MPKKITESGSSPTLSPSGMLQVLAISPGWGSSGHYSQQVLENAARDQVFAKGTHLFLDHPTESEQYERPERSVRDLAAVLTEDARWDGTGLVAEAQVFDAYKPLLTDPELLQSIGLSIRATAETTTGEAEGRKGTIITRLAEGLSIDFVTKAGRGGKVLAVLESSRATAREALSRETRDLLELAVGDNAWVVDFDPDAGQVIYRREWRDADEYHSDLVRDGYAITDGVAALAGHPEQVRQTTDYVPLTGTTGTNEGARTDVPAPAGQHNTQSREGHTMGTIQVDEAEHGRLTEAAGRVPTLITERDTARQERDEARADRDELRETNAARERADAARTIITARAAEAGVEFTALETRGLLANLPIAESGDLDEAAFTTAVDKDAATKAQEAGAGTVHGFGASGGGGTISESDARAVLYGEQKGA